jgi:alkylated DNA repair dioxygenase AlkB
MSDRAIQPALFEIELPHGLVHRQDFITRAEEAALLELFSTLPLREARFKTYYARRRVISFHAADDAGNYASMDDDDLAPGGPLPPLLDALQRKVAAFVGVSPTDFVHVLVSEYRPGTPIGWHRDKPQYGLVAGVSLGSRARMRFRPLPASGEWNRIDPKTLVVLELEPRSVYVMKGAIRSQWQHSLPPVTALRYSVTMRTAAPAPLGS